MIAGDIESIKASDLHYNCDPALSHGHVYKWRNDLLLRLEKSLPKIIYSDEFTQKLIYPRLLSVYESIKSEGLKNPLIVVLDKGEYRVVIGDQRLCCSRALGIKKIPCIITDKIVRNCYEYKEHVYVDGCEERKK